MSDPGWNCRGQWTGSFSDPRYGVGVYVYMCTHVCTYRLCVISHGELCPIGGGEVSQLATSRDRVCPVSECVVHAGLGLVGVKMPGIVMPLVYPCSCPDDLPLTALALIISGSHRAP